MVNENGAVIRQLERVFGPFNLTFNSLNPRVFFPGCTVTEVRAVAPCPRPLYILGCCKQLSSSGLTLSFCSFVPFIEGFVAVFP